MWKLIWFLRDFTYDPERLSQSEVHERALRGLVGVVKIIHACKRHSDVPNCGLLAAFAVNRSAEAVAVSKGERRARRMDDKRAGSLRPVPCSRQGENGYARNFRRRLPRLTRPPPSSMSVMPPSGTSPKNS